LEKLENEIIVTSSQRKEMNQKENDERHEEKRKEE
jgi:hypothetical protein